MELEKISLASKAIELAEADTYIELTNRLCYYGEPNLNGVILPVDGALEKAETLVNMPVVAKYKKINGKDDLGGHEFSVDPLTQEPRFGTENIGTHISVEIKDDDVEIDGATKTLPCLFAKSRIWARNKNVVNAIKRLYAEGSLSSSWELLTSAYSFENGFKTLTDYAFEANALLGSTTLPAYPCATALSLSALEKSQLMIAEAFAIDIQESEEQKENIMAKTKKKTESAIEETLTTEEIVVEVAEAEVVETPAAETVDPIITEEVSEVSEVVETETPAEEEVAEVETSALTEWDLRMRIQQACRDELNMWCWVSYWFPNEKYVWVEYDGRESELDYMMFTYDVSEDDTVVLGEGVPVKLTVSVAEINATLAQKDEALAQATIQISELNEKLAALDEYRVKFEQAEAEKAEAAKEAQRQELSAYALKSGLISEEDLGTEEIAHMISELDKVGINQLIATRFMEKQSEPAVEVAQVESSTAPITASLADEPVAGKSIIQAYLSL